MPVTVVKTFGTTGTFSTPQLWEDGAPAALTTAEQSAAGTFAVASFTQGENLTFVGSGATGKFLHTDSTGPGTGTFITYGITTGNPAASDTVTGDTSTATCILSSGTADFVGVVWQGQSQNQTFSSTATLLHLLGSTSSATAYKHCTTVLDASFRDNPSIQSNALRYNPANGCSFTSSVATGSGSTVQSDENFSVISDIQVENTAADGRALTLSGTTVTANWLIVESTYTNTSVTGGVAAIVGTSLCKNTLIINRASGASHIATSNTGSPFFYNCTFAAPDDLATAPTSVLTSGASGTVTVQNCGLFAGDSTKAIKAGSATFNFTTCYSDISGTAGVTQTTYSSEFQNVNDATRDFRLKTGAAQIDTGTTDTTNAAIDIAKTNRPSGAAYDVGAWELVQAGGGATVITGFGRLMQIVAG
jgi:hypothetical protein